MPPPAPARTHVPDPFATALSAMPERAPGLSPGAKLGWCLLIGLIGAGAALALCAAVVGGLVMADVLEADAAGTLGVRVLVSIPVAVALCITFRAFTGLRLNPVMAWLIPLMGLVGSHFADGPYLALAVGALNLLLVASWMASQIRTRPRAGTSLSDGALGGVIFGRQAAAAAAPVAATGATQGPAPGAPPPFLG